METSTTARKHQENIEPLHLMLLQKSTHDQGITKSAKTREFRILFSARNLRILRRLEIT